MKSHTRIKGVLLLGLLLVFCYQRGYSQQTYRYECVEQYIAGEESNMSVGWKIQLTIEADRCTCKDLGKDGNIPSQSYTCQFDRIEDDGTSVYIRKYAVTTGIAGNTYMTEIIRISKDRSTVTKTLLSPVPTQYNPLEYIFKRM